MLSRRQGENQRVSMHESATHSVDMISKDRREVVADSRVEIFGGANIFFAGAAAPREKVSDDRERCLDGDSFGFTRRKKEIEYRNCEQAVLSQEVRRDSREGDMVMRSRV